MQWLQKIFTKKKSQLGIVGISFLPQGMAIAVSNYTQNNRLKLIHCEFIEIKKNDYSAILKQWFIAHKLGNYDCHLVLDIEDYQRVNIEAPAVPVNEIALAIRWKINDLFDFSIDDAVVDYYPVPAISEEEATLEVIACPNSVVKPLVEQCTQAGLSLLVIDIQETALRNLAALLPDNSLGVAVLYLQKSFGIILIQKRGVIYVARKIAIGYEEVDLENPFATDIPGGMEYEQLTLEKPLFLMDKHTTLRVHDSLALEIQRSLEYMESHYNINTISELAIIPWGMGTQTLVAKLHDFYGINAYLMDLSKIIDCDIALDYATQSLCAPVIGATLRNSVATS